MLNHKDNEKHDHRYQINDDDVNLTIHVEFGKAQNFLRRFFIVTALLVPLAIFSKPGISLLGLSDFALRPYLEFIIATIIFYFSLVFFEHARHEIKDRKYGMMTLVSMGVGAGYLFSAASTFIPTLKAEFYLEISTLVWVLLFGHYLEARSSAAAGDALQEVAKLLPKRAHRITNGQIEEVEVNKLQVGDVVLIKPGEKVPADGIIVKGQANFNESHITGESRPVAKSKGKQVVAGAICLDGSVEVKLEKVGENSTIGQIQKLITIAKQTKPTAQRVADKAAGVLTLTAITVALITVLVWSLIVGESLSLAATLAITVLVIACPHALGLAIPTVSTVATKLAVRNGVFLKDLGKLEVVKDIDYLVFDKTGTLTQGKFGVTDVVAIEDFRKNISRKLNKTKKEILRIVASLETHSTHIIGTAIVEFAKKNKLKLSSIRNFKNIAGRGVQGETGGDTFIIGNIALMEEHKLLSEKTRSLYKKLSSQGKTIAFLANNKKVLGVIALADKIKPESREAVNNLHELGVKVAMLTGDSKEVAAAVAKELEIDTYFAQVLPEKKYEHIKSLQDQDNKVMMVGDGVNDAPALTQADVGVAIGAGTDVAVEAGDIVLTRNNPEDIVSLIILGRRVNRKMVENLVWALGYNILAIPAAAGLFIPFGFKLTPAFGALLMSLSSVIVVINALALRKAKLHK
jgi:Cu2+-exporting ATPase